MDDIGLENHAESRELLKFEPKVTPNPTLLARWIVENYSATETETLISTLVERD